MPVVLNGIADADDDDDHERQVDSTGGRQSGISNFSQRSALKTKPQASAGGQSSSQVVPLPTTPKAVAFGPPAPSGTASLLSGDSHPGCQSGNFFAAETTETSVAPISHQHAAVEDDEEKVPIGMILHHIEREIILKRSCKAIPFGVFFWMCFVWSAWLKCDVYNFGLGASMIDMFETIPVHKWGRLKYLKAGDRVHSGGDLFEYLVDGVVPMLWAEKDARVRKHHKIVGGLRLRQERAVLMRCEEEKLSNWYTPMICRDSNAGLSMEPFGNGTDDAAFKPNDKGYFYAMLPIDKPVDEIQSRLADLWKTGWLDYSTQAITLELAVYNGEVDAWAQTHDIFEFHESGLVQHRLKVSTGNNMFAHWYYYVADVWVWGCLITLLIEEICYMIAKIRQGRFFSQYIHGAEAYWKVGEWATIVLGIFGMTGYLMIQGMRTKLAEKLVANPDAWGETLDNLAAMVVFKKQHEVVLFFLAVSIMIRFFKIFHGQPRLAVMSMTFSLCCTELMYFFIIFLTIFSNFAMTSFILFNSQLKPWRGVFNSFNECFKILMGNFSFKEMFEVHKFAASLWFWLFMTSVFIITVNMLLAVILETYMYAKVMLGQDTQKGFVTQLHHLWLQSPACRMIKERSGGAGWISLEKLRDNLIELEESYATAMGETHSARHHTVPPGLVQVGFGVSDSHSAANALAQVFAGHGTHSGTHSAQSYGGSPSAGAASSRISGQMVMGKQLSSSVPLHRSEYGVSIKTLMNMGAPEDQADFLWKIVAPQAGIGGDKKEHEGSSDNHEKSAGGSHGPDLFLGDDDDDEEEEEVDISLTFEKYEESMETHEVALRAGLSEILSRLSVMETTKVSLPGTAS